MINRKTVIDLCCSCLLLFTASSAYATDCTKAKFALQVLGSGGPEINDGRASTSYLLWIKGHARIMVDAGSGSNLLFEQSGANFNDIELMLISHLHTDHISELESYIKGSYFTDRASDLFIYGPTGNDLVPSISTFTRKLFTESDAAYKYLSEYFDRSSNAPFKAHSFVVPDNGSVWRRIFKGDRYILEAAYVHHGPIPALAWKVTYFGRSIAFTGDTDGSGAPLAELLKGSDVIVAHNAIPETAGRIARNLHMPPSVIGELAEQANPELLVLSHRMLRTTGNEKQTLEKIKEYYRGLVDFAEDLSCYVIEP